MRILFLGDVVGISGCSKLMSNLLSEIKSKKVDFVIVNAENAASQGVGLTKEICNDFFNCGVDVITTGNHVWDQKEIMEFIDKEEKLLRPKNLFEPAPGKGFNIYETKNNIKIGVLNLMGNVFMKKCDDVSEVSEKFMKQHKLKQDYDLLVVDFHGEITSEKNAIGHFFDGKASLVVGTHTHIPTNDARILTGGTGVNDEGAIDCSSNLLFTTGLLGISNNIQFEGDIYFQGDATLDISANKTFDYDGISLDISNNNTLNIYDELYLQLLNFKVISDNKTLRSLCTQWLLIPKSRQQIMNEYGHITIWQFSPHVTDMSRLFQGNNYLRYNENGNYVVDSFNEDISGWNTQFVTNMSSMFLNNNKFNRDIGKWNVSNVTQINSMFNGTQSFRYNLADWDVSNLESAYKAFYGIDMSEQDLSKWRPHKLMLAGKMFELCRNFNMNLKYWILPAGSNTCGMLKGVRLIKRKNPIKLDTLSRKRQLGRKSVK